MSIWTTCLNEERSALTKAVGYGSADSNLMTGGFEGGGLRERFLAVRTRVLLAIRLDLRTGNEEISGVALGRFTCPYKKTKSKKQLISKLEKHEKRKTQRVREREREL